MTPQERLDEIETLIQTLSYASDLKGAKTARKMIWGENLIIGKPDIDKALTHITALKPLFDSMYDSLIAADIVFNAYVDAINGEMTASELASLHDATQEKIKQTLDEMKDALQEKMK